MNQASNGVAQQLSTQAPSKTRLLNITTPRTTRKCSRPVWLMAIVTNHRYAPTNFVTSDKVDVGASRLSRNVLPQIEEINIDCQIFRSWWVDKGPPMSYWAIDYESAAASGSPANVEGPWGEAATI